MNPYHGVSPEPHLAPLATFDEQANHAAQLLQENRMTLNELARQEGKHPSTVHRWASRGVGGTKLETFKVGGKRYTTKEAHVRFVARTSGQPGFAKVLQFDCLESRIARAEQLLKREGA